MGCDWGGGERSSVASTGNIRQAAGQGRATWLYPLGIGDPSEGEMTRGSQCLKSQINEQLASGIKYRQKRLQLRQEHYSELMKVDGLGPYFIWLIYCLETDHDNALLPLSWYRLQFSDLSIWGELGAPGSPGGCQLPGNGPGRAGAPGHTGGGGHRTVLR